MHWGYPSLIHTASSLLNGYEMVCKGDLLYRLIEIKFTNMLSMYVQSGTHRYVHWRVIAVLMQNRTVLMFLDVNEAPKL